MKTKFIEVTNGELNWGKFMLLQFDTEWEYKSTISKGKMLRSIGFNPNQVWVLDLQTCEGAAFSVVEGGYVKGDLDKHSVWVCPMYEPFLGWLYKQPKREGILDLDSLPNHVNLPDAKFAMYGYRRPGLTK